MNTAFVTLFPTTVKRASCKVRELLCPGWLPTTISISVVLLLLDSSHLPSPQTSKGDLERGVALVGSGVVVEGNRKRNVSKKVVVKDLDNYYYDGLDAQLCR